MGDDSSPIQLDLVLRHSDWVRSLTRALAREEADDLAQAVWTSALSAGSRPRANLRGWLRTIARNHLARRQRRRALRPHVETLGARGEALDSTDDLVTRAELQRRVLEEVMALPETQRRVVLLRYFESRSYEDIAHETGVPASTARTRVSRAFERLRERLDGDYGTRGSWALLALAPADLKTPFLLETLLMTAKTKIAITTGLAITGVCALLGVAVWPVADSTRASEEVAEAFPENPPPERSHVEPVEPHRTEHEEPAPARSAPVVPDREPPTPAPSRTPAETWFDVETVAARILDGSVTLADLLGTAEELMGDLDESSFTRSEDGTRAFELFTDGDLGQAHLHVHPGKRDEPGEFELRMSLEAAPGFRYPEDASGGTLRMGFGLSEDAPPALSAFFQAEVSWANEVHERHLGQGPMKIGGSILLDATRSTWRPLTLEVVTTPEGDLGHRMQMLPAEDRYLGEIDDARLESLAARMRSLRL